MSSFMRRYLENGIRDTTKVTTNDQQEVALCAFDWLQAPRSMTLVMTLDERELVQLQIFLEFTLLRILGRPICQGCRALTFALAGLSCKYTQANASATVWVQCHGNDSSESLFVILISFSFLFITTIKQTCYSSFQHNNDSIIRIFNTSLVSPVHAVAENGDSRRKVAEIGDYSRQCGQAFTCCNCRQRLTIDFERGT